LAFQPIPFSKAGNPIMSTVAFLSSVVDPRIASSAAKAAMDEFCKIKDQVPTSLLDSHLKSVAQNAAQTGIRDPSFGLAQSGIAGTAPIEKEVKDKVEDDKSEEKKDVKSEDDKVKSESVPEGDTTVVKMETDENGAEKEKKGEAEGDKEKVNGNEVAIPETDQERLAKDSTLQSAAAAALSAAAVKAKHLAAVEERKIKSLVALLVETQMKVTVMNI